MKKEKFIYHMAVGLVALSVAVTSCMNAANKSKEENVESKAAAAEQIVHAPDSVGYIVRVGDVAPDFEMTLADGKTVKLSSLRGKVVMLQFTASWCSVCRREMPFIEKDIWKKHQNNPNFALFGIDRDEPLETVKIFIEKTGVTYPMALDSGADIFAKYADRKSGITRNVLIDKDGRIVMLTRLFNTEEFEALRKKIDQMLADGAEDSSKQKDKDSFKNRLYTVAAPNKYICWPRIGKVGDRLVNVYVKALKHDDPHNGVGAIYASCSADGITWTPDRKVIDTPNMRDGVTGCGNDADGNLIFIIRVGYFSNPNAYYEMYRTTNGVDFEKISTIPHTQPLGHCGDIINIPTRGLMAFFGTYGNDRSWGYILSEDNGNSWKRVVVESVEGNDCPMEMSAAYLGDGKMLVVGRYEGDGSAAMWQMESSDYGRSWNRKPTNIKQYGNTPNLIFDAESGRLSLYIYNRGTGDLEYREIAADKVWNNPSGWPSATILTTKNKGYHAGNVSACVHGNQQIATFYAGDEVNTGIYCMLK